MPNPVIDLDDVLERVQDDWELLLELFEVFEQDYKEKRILLDQEVSSRNLEQVRNIAHSLKGASGNISATGFHAVFLQMEQAAVNGDLDGVRRLLGQMDQQFPELQQGIAKIREDYKKSQA